MIEGATSPCPQGPGSCLRQSSGMSPGDVRLDVVGADEFSVTISVSNAYGPGKKRQEYAGEKGVMR